MKKWIFKNQFRQAVLFAVLLSFASQGFSAQVCDALFKPDQNALVHELKNSPVAIGRTQLGDKSIPTILVNKDALPALAPVFQRTLGIVVAHQKGYNNDHGLFRLGDYFIDRDLPGGRARGEIHNTGISWAGVKSYVEYNEGRNGSYNRVEVLFELTLDELNTVTTYQKMRRAAIIRPDFSFGRTTNYDGKNKLSECGENCFGFSTGSGVSSQIYAIKKRLQNLGVKAPDDLLKEKDVRKFLSAVKLRILNSELGASYLNPKIYEEFELPASIMNSGLVTAENKQEFLNWIIGLDISNDYQELLDTLSIQGASDYSNARSSRASAVLIYDSTTKKEDFLKDTYASEGIFSTWRHQGLTIENNGVTNVTENVATEKGLFRKLVDGLAGL